MTCSGSGKIRHFLFGTSESSRFATLFAKMKSKLKFFSRDDKVSISFHCAIPRLLCQPLSSSLPRNRSFPDTQTFSHPTIINRCGIIYLHYDLLNIFQMTVVTWCTVGGGCSFSSTSSAASYGAQAQQKQTRRRRRKARAHPPRKLQAFPIHNETADGYWLVANLQVAS